ncbi:MAG: PDZ domain-containing protein [Gammaproteobacteria bacterium]|nr:PDZ domain-containing protein [Gammaproteobacteria bacterium]
MKHLLLCLTFTFAVSGLTPFNVADAAEETAPTDAELEKRLAEARERLDKAAQEISEVTTRLHGDAMKHVVRMVHNDGGKPRAVIGINIGERNENGKVTGVSPKGVVVLGVTPGGSADEAGLKTNDIITHLNGKSLEGDGKASNDKLMAIMNDVSPGDTVKIEYLRDGKKGKIDLETGEMTAPHFSGMLAPGSDHKFFRWNSEAGGAPMPPIPAVPGVPGMPMIAPMPAHGWGGMELVQITPKLGEYFKTDQGLLVVRAPEAEDVELEEGDVILSIGGREPKDVRHAMRILRSYAAEEKVEMEIMRKKRKRKISFTIDKNATYGAAPGFQYRFMTPEGEGDYEVHVERGANGGDKEVIIKKKVMKMDGAAAGDADEVRIIVEEEKTGT